MPGSQRASEHAPAELARPRSRPHRAPVGRPAPVGAYADFALGAGAMLLGEDRRPAVRSPTGWRPAPRWRGWRVHLTTLFPEVRPRGYFELRSCDALARAWLAAPLVFVCALALDDASTARRWRCSRSPARPIRRCGARRPLRMRMATRRLRCASSRLACGRRLGEGVLGRPTSASRATSSTSTPRGGAHRPTTSRARGRRVNGRRPGAAGGARHQRYRQHDALSDTSLAVARGECVALIGESGSGKTRPPRCSTARSTPTEGRVLVDGAL